MTITLFRLLNIFSTCFQISEAGILMASATLKVNLHPSGPDSGCEWWWWSRGLHLKLLVSSKASRKEMQDQSYGPCMAHACIWAPVMSDKAFKSHLTKMQTILQAHLYRIFEGSTFANTLKKTYHNSLSVFAFWFHSCIADPLGCAAYMIATASFYEYY